MPMRSVEHRDKMDKEHIKQRQERELGPNSEEFIVHTRAVDHSFWLRISYLIDKYKLLWYIVIAFLVSLGYNFKTPAQNYREMETTLSGKINSVSSRVDTMFLENQKAAVSRDKIESKLDVLITFRCLEQNQRDLILAGVDCSKFTNNQKVTPK